MYDRDTAMLDQYDLTVKNIKKVRSGWLCIAQEGLFLWKESSSGEDRLHLEDVVCREIEAKELGERWKRAGGEGYLRMDQFIRNRDGCLLTEDRYGRCFVLKKWTDGRECEVRTLEDLYNGARAAACMHQAMRYLDVTDIEKQLVQKKIEEKRWTEEANEDLELPEWGERLVQKTDTDREREMNPSMGEIQENFGERQNTVHMMKSEAAGTENCDGDIESVKISRLSCRESCIDLWLRRKKEIIRVESYIRRRKNKNALEQLMMKETPYFADQAEIAIGMLGEVSEKLENYVCHGDFHYHNLIYSSGENWICQSSRFHLGPQIMDFYLFLRKCMEKHNWDWELAEDLLGIYRQNCLIKGEELQFLYCLFLFPEKYWKQLNFYIQSNKAWMPEKNVVKLKNVIGLETKRQAFLEKFKTILE